MRKAEIIFLLVVTIIGAFYSSLLGGRIVFDLTLGVLGMPFIVFLLVFCAILIFGKSRNTALRIIREHLFVRMITGLVLIFWMLLLGGSGPKIRTRELTVEDCQAWVEEETDLPDEVAHVEKRIFNSFFDGLMFFGLQTICLSRFEGFTPANALYIAVIIIFLWLLYYPVMEYKTGKTMAKFITQTRVVSTDIFSDEGRMGAGQALGRNLLRFLPFEGFSFFSAYPIGWHDSFSHSLVVNDPPIPDAIEWEDEIPDGIQ